ncbi:MAG TPA: sporulation protein [Flavobacterium sp.]|nr:sporulation protein [Flavobacterium sp.]
MGFFQTIKNKLGIGGVKVSLQSPGQVGKSEGMINGKVTLTSKSDQELVKMKVILLEEYTTGRGDDKKKKDITLGTFNLDLKGATIKAGETVEHSFALPFQVANSSNQDLAEKGGALGALGKMGSFANNEKSEYFVVAEVDVKSAALDSSDKQPIRLM